MNKKIDFAAVVCVVLMFAGFLSLAAKMATRFLMKKGICSRILIETVFFDEPLMLDEYNRGIAGNFISVDWAKEYPFTSKESERFAKIMLEEKDVKSDEAKHLQIGKIVNAVAFINKFLGDHFPKKYLLTENLKRLQKIVGLSKLSEEESDIKNIGNGFYSSFLTKKDILTNARVLKELSDFLASKGTPFIYVQAPYKVDPDDKSISGVKDFSNQNTDELLEYISGFNVTTIDMRKEIKNAGKNFYECFYKTDHHWTAETGLLAAKIIAEKVNELSVNKVDVSVLESKNYERKVYPKIFLGSRGRALTLVNCGMEDFTLITPKFEPVLDTEVYLMNSLYSKRSGGFETLLFPEWLQKENAIYEKNSYAIYLFGDTVDFIKNNGTKSNARILMLGDSFTDVVEPFFCLGTKQFDALDLRVFNGSLCKYIEDNSPYDAVVMILNPGSYDDFNLWNFQ